MMTYMVRCISLARQTIPVVYVRVFGALSKKFDRKEPVGF